MNLHRILVGDNRQSLARLPAASVHAIVTSPPYWSLREYPVGAWVGGDPDCDHRVRLSGTVAKSQASSTLLSTSRATEGHSREGYRRVCGRCGARRVDNQTGLEDTPDEYVAGLVALFGECRRVLRPDGTLWLNLGDTYARPGEKGGSGPGGKERAWHDGAYTDDRPRGLPAGYKDKDLLGLPWRVVFGLQAQGWTLRAAVVWHKTNAKPESVQDRPTVDYEPVFMLTQGPRYYYDGVAVAEPSRQDETETRQLRAVWGIPVARYAGAHFAVMPTALAARCIAASTSERGACPACGAPWRRLTRVTREGGRRRVDTLGWEPTCRCEAGEPVPATVLDPFGGAMTTALAAGRLGRDSLSLELSADYARQGEARLLGDGPMLGTVRIERQENL